MSQIAEKKFPLVLEVVRRRFEWTQIELAQLIDKSQTEISWWETGAYKLPVKVGLVILKIFQDHATDDLVGIVSRLKNTSDLQKSWEDFIEDGSKEAPVS